MQGALPWGHSDRDGPAAAPSGVVYRLHRGGWQSGGVDDTVAGGAMARSGVLFGIVVLSGAIMGPAAGPKGSVRPGGPVGPNESVVHGLRGIHVRRDSGAVWRERYMSIVLLLLFVLCVVRMELRAVWECGPEHDFLKAQPDERELRAPAILGMLLWVAWFRELSSSSGWWCLLLALLVLWFALFMLCALGAALIHPEQLGLSSGHARSTLTVVSMDRGSEPRGASVLLFLVLTVALMGLFVYLLPDEADRLRWNTAIGLLLLMAASGVMLGWVVFRPWSIIRQHPNHEDAQAFCLLVMMLFFHSALLAAPADREGRVAVGACGVLLLCAALLLKLVRRVTGGRHGHPRQMSAATLYLSSIPVCLMTGVMLVPDVRTPEPSPSMAVQHASMTHQEAWQRREHLRPYATNVPPVPAQAPVPVSAIMTPASGGSASGRTATVLKPDSGSNAKTGRGSTAPVAGDARATPVGTPAGTAEPSLETRLTQIVRERIRDLITDSPEVRVTRNDRGAFRIGMRPGVFYHQPEDADVIRRVAEKLHASLRAVDAEGVRMHAVEMQVWTMAKDRYGNPFEKAVISLSLRDPDLSRINWNGIDEAQLLDLVRVTWQPDGLAAAWAYCLKPEHRYESAEFCTAAAQADAASGVVRKAGTEAQATSPGSPSAKRASHGESSGSAGGRTSIERTSRSGKRWAHG